MAIGREDWREDWREGDNGDARGDETTGRFVLIASDMIQVVSERMVEVTVDVKVQCGRENACGYLEGVMLALGKEGSSERRLV
jgi:hypothetical protein